MFCHVLTHLLQVLVFREHSLSGMAERKAVNVRDPPFPKLCNVM